MANPPVTPPFEGEALLFTGGFHAAFLAALHRSDWTVGPYTEMAALTWRAGPRGVRLRRTSLGVASRFSLPSGWDVGEPASIKWLSEGSWRELYWEDRGLRVHADIGRRSLSRSIPRRWLEPSAGGFIPPGWVVGRVIPVRLEMEVQPGDPLEPMAGPHRGLLFSSMARPPSRLARAKDLLLSKPEASPEAV